MYFLKSPELTLSAAPVTGLKKEKSQFTRLTVCNLDVSEGFSLMFIGEALRPRLFGHKSGAERGLDYHANVKAWLTINLFIE